MILYHGTNIEFDKIELSKSRIAKDFGIGFYLTPDKYVAERQALRKVEQGQEGTPVIQSYNWDEPKSSTLKILRFDKYSVEWARFIFQNRSNRTRIQCHDYDIVIGPIADDTVGLQVRRFKDGIITIEQLIEEIKWHKVTIQYLFATEESLKTLSRL